MCGHGPTTSHGVDLAGEPHPTGSYLYRRLVCYQTPISASQVTKPGHSLYYNFISQTWRGAAGPGGGQQDKPFPEDMVFYTYWSISNFWYHDIAVFSLLLLTFI